MTNFLLLVVSLFLFVLLLFWFYLFCRDYRKRKKIETWLEPKKKAEPEVEAPPRLILKGNDSRQQHFRRLFLEGQEYMRANYFGEIRQQRRLISIAYARNRMRGAGRLV